MDHPTDNTPTQEELELFETFLKNVKGNNTYPIQQNMDRIISIVIKYPTSRMKYDILKHACRYSLKNLFELIVKKIRPLEVSEISEAIFYCACAGKLRILEILISWYPDTLIIVGKLSIRKIQNEGPIPAYEVVDVRDDQINTTRMGVAKYALMGFFTILEKYNVESIRELTYQLVDMPFLFDTYYEKSGVNELIWVLLRFNECARAQKLLEGTVKNESKSCFDTEDTLTIYRQSSPEAIELLVEYYYYDAFSALSEFIVGEIFGRINMLLFPGLIDMISERELFETSHVQRYFVSAYVKNNLANLRFLYERYPDADVLKDIPSVAHYPNETPESKEVVDWVLKIFPHKKRKV